MSEYEKLVGILRNYSAEVISYKIDGAFAYAATAAADAIEQLVKERDAAIADIKKCWLCASCRNHIENKEWCFCCHFDPETDSDGCTTCENWEWRGVGGD